MTDKQYDTDDMAQKLHNYMENVAGAHMPAPVQIDIIDGSMQFVTGRGWGRLNDRIVSVMLFGPYDLRQASAASPYTIWALPPDSKSATTPYIMLGVVWNGSEGGRVPRINGIVDDTLTYV